MREKSLDNIYSRHMYLLDTLRKTESIRREQIVYLSGQRKFASFSIKGKFKAMSLNTLKEAANILLTKEAGNKSGFEYLDELRTKLYQKVKKRKSSRTKPKVNQRRNIELKQLKSMLQEAEAASIIRTKAYSELLENLTTILRTDELDDKTRIRLSNIINHHNELYSDLLSPISEIKKSHYLKLITKGKE